MNGFIQSRWRQYEAANLSDAAGKIQRQQLCHAFYCGAAQVTLHIYAAASSGVADDDGAAFLGGLLTECEQFVATLNRG